MSKGFFEGRFVGVRLMCDGPRSVTSDIWAMPRHRAVSMLDSLPKLYYMYSHLSFGYRRGSATDGNSVGYSMAVKIV